MSDRRLVVTVKDYWELHSSADGSDAFDAWVESITGRPLNEPPHVVTAALGEGIVELELLPEHALPTETYRAVYPAPVPPPVWPAGWSER